MDVIGGSEPSWKFKPKTKDDMAVDPFQDEFFKTDSVGGFSHALLRETIQNTLDAKAENCQEVRIRISIFRGNAPMHDAKYRSFFNGLNDHLNTHNNGLIDRPSSNASLDFLVIEDFNTTGLEGDPELADNPDDESLRENFFYFWRNYGRSGKSGSERGRWGLGKTVFSAVSKINTFFGLTIRESDHRALLMGQSVLKIHTAGNKSFMPYGGFGTFGDSQGEQFFPVPIEDESSIRTFTETFHLTRTIEPGFSIVIPFPYEDISLHSLKAGIIKQFFYPIISGELSVTIQENGECTELNREDVIPLITNGAFLTSEFDGETEDVDLLKLFSFARSAIEMQDDAFVILNPPEDLTALPAWHDELFNEVSLVNLRKQFDQNEIIGFKIPIKVQRIGHQAKLNWFRAFVQRDGTLHSAENYFIREGIRISSMTSFKERGIRGMVVIDEGELTTLIGDAENPAHTEWQKDSSKFRNKYKHGSKTIDFVKASLREIIRRLMKPAEGVDNELLGEVFYYDLPRKQQPDEKPKTARDKKEKGEKPGDGPEVEVISRTRPILLSKISGGVRIYHNPASEKNLSSAEITFAYAVRKGNAIKKYNKPDFDLASESIKISGSGFEIDHALENVLKIDITDQAFDITVTGFDEQRDLVIKSSWSEVTS
jgi:hypothetical protein